MKTVTDAAKVLLEAGWEFSEVAGVLREAAPQQAKVKLNLDVSGMPTIPLEEVMRRMRSATLSQCVTCGARAIESCQLHPGANIACPKSKAALRPPVAVAGGSTAYTETFGNPCICGDFINGLCTRMGCIPR